MARKSRNPYPPGTLVRCFRADETGRVGRIVEATGGVPGKWRYVVEWTDGKTPQGYPTRTQVGLINIIGREA